MSKIEIIGPRELLLQVLSLIQQLGVLQIEEKTGEGIDERVEPHLKSLLLDREMLSEQMFLENLGKKFNLLLACFPGLKVREAYLSPSAALEALPNLIDQHLATCQELVRKRESLQQELLPLCSVSAFLNSIAPLVAEVKEGFDLDFIGMEIKNPAMLEELTAMAHRLTEGQFEIQTAPGPDGTLVGLIATERDLADRLRKSLRKDRLPEVSLPPFLQGLPFAEKLPALKKRIAELEAGILNLNGKLDDFARRWLAIYKKTGEWVGNRLALIKKTASLFQTEMCFFIFGWIASADLEKIRYSLASQFGGKVVVEEKEILVQDLERVPVAMKNPTYFQPFELFARLLPLPHYGSFDPTPYIGIFFPIFFGMILGDIGYGVILLFVALCLVFLVKQKKNVIDAGKILGVAALYTIFFGWLFGECFGEFGSKVLGLEPICFDRMSAILPMLYFAISVGVFHVVLGLALGAISAMKRKLKKEAFLKLLSILVILCLVLYLATFVAPLPTLLRKPLLAAVMISVPILMLCGGILAPLELLRTFGNIISYARIMAVGLTSVLLAYVANELAGRAGSVLLGILVAVLLHTFNILLGVFAPTVHTLRLHYVEFFSKFLEPGGRKFEPMEKK